MDFEKGIEKKVIGKELTTIYDYKDYQKIDFRYTNIISYTEKFVKIFLLVFIKYFNNKLIILENKNRRRYYV